MTARLNNLEVAVATSISQATATHETTTANGAMHTPTLAVTTVDTRHVTYVRGPDGGDGGVNSSSSDSHSDDGEDDLGDSPSGSDGGGAGGGWRGRHAAPAQRHGRRKNIRDLELTPFQPSSNNSVLTWIKKVDLALEGARISGRGGWTGGELYYIVGNKLQDDAARFWAQVDLGMRPEMRTWSYLKAALKRRYGQRPDKSQAELRVNQRYLMPGETFADFAAGLRDDRGETKMSERVLLAQFIRNLPKTTRQLIRESKPKTLDKAVDKATEVDDPFDNVAQGIKNIGQEWITAQMTYPIAVGAASGHAMVVPGVGVRDSAIEMTLTTPTDPDWAIFSNPQGVWNKFTGIWDIPEGRVWNGRYWDVRPTRKRTAKPTAEKPAKKTAMAPKAEKKAIAKVKMVKAEDSEDDEVSEDKLVNAAPATRPTKRQKAKRTKATTRTTRGAEQPRQQSESQPAVRPIGQISCYACGRTGHFAKSVRTQRL
ncbi:hypothetical protein P3T76_015557 [Phytophthora citrophthora]|uniref:CCHC-type domain-containing protein n=1 Tax=Phytophthora citrophthora TaxID=4793 RepID=A0AAD9FZQ0_9STRA|nr:hypothetical protein P3T76_015557 [Phytophthora citrophthora]